MTIQHIIPSGSEKTLCGLDASKENGSSLGMGCNCNQCYEKAIKLMKKE